MSAKDLRPNKANVEVVLAVVIPKNIEKIKKIGIVLKIYQQEILDFCQYCNCKLFTNSICVGKNVCLVGYFGSNLIPLKAKIGTFFEKLSDGNTETTSTPQTKQTDRMHGDDSYHNYKTIHVFGSPFNNA